IAAYERGRAIRPDAAEVYNNLANGLREKLQVEDALANYDRALVLEPDHPGTRWNRALILLLMGRFDEGWREYEWRWKKFPHEKRRVKALRWDGYDITGKTILLHAEQGFGDALQFARYAALVADRGAQVIL